jgi:outer membrane protein assembly factor BamB
MEKVKYMKTIVKTLFVVVLMVAIAFPMTTLPTEAAPTSAKATFALVGAMPNPVGLGQSVLVATGITDYVTTAMGFTGLTLIVTHPDNTTETIGPYNTDSTGMTGITYTPDTLGTYYLQTHFPAQWFNTTASNTYYKESYSEKLALIVQEEAVKYYSGEALPTEYWTRPINAQLREWYTISGSWLTPTPILPTDNLYAADNDDAPESAHVLWTRDIGDTLSGLAGGIDATGYGIGDAYEGKWGAISISGILCYNKYDAGQPQQKAVAVDLHTGETLWERTLGINDNIYGNGRISFGQILRFKSMNYQGDFAYLWVVSGTNWYAFDPKTGDWKYNMTNVPSGTNYYGPQGEILRYSINTNAGWLAQWNTTSTVFKGLTGGSVAWGSQVRGKSFDAQAKGYDWNVSIPKGLPGSVRTVNPGDRLVGASINSTAVQIWAINLDESKGTIGSLLYNKAWNAPAQWADGNLTISWAAASLTDNVAALVSKETRSYYAFDLTDGTFLWGPSDPDSYLNLYDRITTINYGKLVTSGAGGDIICYNAKTGEELWSYTAEDLTTEFTIGNDWWMQQLIITDGKVYLGHVEHSPNQPLPRGAPFLCLNITSGEVIWKMEGGYRQTCWGGKAVIGDSILVFQDTYEGRIYAVGKGPSYTQVSASPKISTNGESVLIEGSVTDISPGTEKYALKARFPQGVPAVSDESQSQWMKYVYMQFSKPTNTTGVPVSLDTLDPNGNYIHIGNTISDASGKFCYQWIPEVPGKYTVYASFPGSNSYYSSTSETFIAVEEIDATVAPTEQPQASVADTYFVPAVAGLFIAIILLGALMIVLQRKHP